MKVIFDSEEQKLIFIKICQSLCDKSMGLDYADCEDCWKRNRMEMEVKDECRA